MSFSDVSGSLADRLRKIQEKKAPRTADEHPVDHEELYQLRARILGVLIRDARQARQRSTAALAAGLGIEEALLLDWEHGLSHPSLPQLELLAYELGVPVSHFWGAEMLPGNGTGSPLPREDYLELRDRVLGAQLRQARLDADLTLEQLGEQVGLPPEQLAAYEMGEAPVPLAELTSIASATKVSLAHFLESGNRVGQWLALQESFRRFSELPEATREFISNPSNRSFVELAIWFSALDVNELRGLAESILNLSRLEQGKMRRIAEGILNDITL